MISSEKLLKLMERANRITLEHHGKEITIERAIFLTWWCDKGDCKFCYMSAQRPKIKNPEKAKRRISRILAEAEICRRMGINIEFLSGGYGLYTARELKEIAELVAYVYNSPLWLNVGVLPSSALELFGEEVEGITGAIETFDMKLHDFVCPSKPVAPILKMLENANEMGYKTGITIILGLGERLGELPWLFKVIKEYKIDRITFYSLNPHKDTYFADYPPPPSLYQAYIIARTRIEFPKVKIVSGTWIDQLSNIGACILAGANGITKFPLFSIIGNRYGKKIEEEVRAAGRRLKGTLTDITKLNNASIEERKFGQPHRFIEIKPEFERMVKDYIDKIIKRRS